MFIIIDYCHFRVCLDTRTCFAARGISWVPSTLVFHGSIVLFVNAILWVLPVALLRCRVMDVDASKLQASIRVLTAAKSDDTFCDQPLRVAPNSCLSCGKNPSSFSRHLRLLRGERTYHCVTRERQPLAESQFVRGVRRLQETSDELAEYAAYAAEGLLGDEESEKVCRRVWYVLPEVSSQLGFWVYTGELDCESLLCKYGVAKSLVLPVSTVRAVTQVQSLQAATALEEVSSSVVFKETPGLDVLQHSTHVREQEQQNLPPAKKLSRAKRKAAQRVQAKLS